MTKVWKTLVRWRTWIVNLFASLLLVLPEILNAPEVIAVIPAEYQKYVFVGALLLNILMRPRPAVMADDLEASVSRSRRAK